jgi:hypothetical protein
VGLNGEDRMKKKLILPILAIAVLLFGAYIINNGVRCKKSGLMRDKAIEIAYDKLKIEFKKAGFLLKNEQFEDSDKSWLFTYHEGDCVVDVIIDRCGVSNIGGLSAKCQPLQK